LSNSLENQVGAEKNIVVASLSPLFLETDQPMMDFLSMLASVFQNQPPKQ
jgi:hypothetical protein